MDNGVNQSKEATVERISYGSNKQIEWATKIRDERLAELNTGMERARNHYNIDADGNSSHPNWERDKGAEFWALMLEIKAEWETERLDASWWIDRGRNLHYVNEIKRRLAAK